ncbi:probable aminotransferase protein [Stappia aggregata IAM 12614]|uniref:Probable aminotransferase protein n=1 Tax=Roseibium aggregatum (strain ATCC 25650 / DSM 13394 / JCM 20685 / NBRC 16684 / NCIMB 2208 / IAM 12614 / B1) TaxID=384765 RepID=A0NVE4_ROSAI|nr:PLP-dependent aminotransferase family protein [Roseibium aggregatum]EAV43411.1 probable aminotransferase protein [Stappia aggregata IAM 12614] [Roseibium aggregatum IAM 12614]
MTTWESLYARRASRMRASEIRELLKLLDRPDVINFAGGIPDQALFPAEAFKEAYQEILAGDGAGRALQYGMSEGSARLRNWIVSHMRGLGVECGPENILVTSGSQQGLDYIGKLFLTEGDTALVQWPTYLGALQAFNAYEPGYDRLDPGVNRPAEDFAAAARERGGRIKFAYLSPDFANPTGLTVDLAGRKRLLTLAGELSCAVIEDSPYESLRYDGEALPPMLALDCEASGGINNARTLYCGSFSKSLSPGLRLGWICAAADVISRLVLIKQASDLNSPVLNQEAMARVAENVFEAHTAKTNAVYKARRDAMLAALEQHMPAGVSWTRPEGGMFIWMTLPEGLDAAALLETSIETVRVAFVPGRAFHPDGTGANTLRLSFSCNDYHKIEEGISRLGRLIRETVTSKL